MSAITSPVILDSTGQQIVEKLHTQNLLLDILAGATLEHTENLDEIANIVKSGKASEVFNIGDQIIVPWKDTAANKTYSMPFDVVHFGNVTLEDQETVPGMFLQAHYAHPIGVQFSHQRAFLACPEGLAPGTYYFTFEASWGTNVSAGDVVAFTTTVAVPAGGRVAGCYGAPDQAKANWRIYTYNAAGTEIIETITPTFVTPASGTNLGTMKATARQGNLNCAQEMAYGYNNLLKSAVRQYLNSAAAIGGWWTAQDEWDIAPDQLATKPGFLSGFEEDFLNVIKAVKVQQAANTVNDEGATLVMYDKAFLPSLKEMNIEPQDEGGVEGEIWEYWKRVSGSATPLARSQTYPQLRTYALENKTSAQNVRLRSAYRGGAYYTWFVNSSGSVYYHLAYAAYRFAPAVVIC